jgi:hypothetical protein
MIKKYFVTYSVITLFCTGCLQHAEQPSITQNVSWIGYTNSTHGFTFNYPIGSRVIAQTGDYLRIEKYALNKPENDTAMLEDGEFYLKINIISSDPSCEDAIVNPEPIKAGNANAWIGVGKDQAGDAGGVRYVLCSPIKGHTLFATATENDKQTQGAIAQSILRSFRFK